MDHLRIGGLNPIQFQVLQPFSLRIRVDGASTAPLCLESPLGAKSLIRMHRNLQTFLDIGRECQDHQIIGRLVPYTDLHIPGLLRTYGLTHQLAARVRVLAWRLFQLEGALV